MTRDESIATAALREARAASATATSLRLAVVWALAPFFFIITMTVMLARSGTLPMPALRVVQLVMLQLAGAALLLDAGGVRGLWGRPQLSLGGWVAALIGVMLVAAAAQGLGRLLPMRDGLLVRIYHRHGLGAPELFFAFCVLAPIAEEVLFRGVALGGLLRLLPAGSATVVSAILFAATHLAPASLLHLTLLGWVLARVRLGTRSLYPCMLLHAGYNALTLWLVMR